MSATRSFRATIEEGRGGGALVVVPFDVGEAFGSKRPKVKATFDGHAYRGSVASMGGRFILGMPKAVRQAAGKDVGDAVDVTLARDTEPRIVAVPDDLAAALAADALRERFDGLAYTHRKEYVAWIGEAKREETRARRVAKAVDMVREGETRP